MLTAEELEAQEVFDKALQKAWEEYLAIEIPARNTRQEATRVAFEDMKKAVNLK